MTAEAKALSAEVPRWALAALTAVSAHVAVAAYVLHTTAVLPEPADASGAMVVELADMKVASAHPSSADEGPERTQGAVSAATQSTKPDEVREENSTTEQQQVQPKSSPSSEVVLPEQAPRPEPTQAASVASAGDVTTSAPKVESETIATVAAAPAVATAAKADPKAVARWHGQISERLERNKRYPREARSNGQQGVVEVAFVLDRSGRLISSRISKSSGLPLLDQEAMQLLQRAQPFPILQDAVTGSEISLIVPIRFRIR